MRERGRERERGKERRRMAEGRAMKRGGKKKDIEKRREDIHVIQRKMLSRKIDKERLT